MELPPLIERELRVALRKQSPRKVRLGATVGVATATAASLGSRNRRRALANRLILAFREVAPRTNPRRRRPALETLATRSTPAAGRRALAGRVGRAGGPAAKTRASLTVRSRTLRYACKKPAE